LSRRMHRPRAFWHASVQSYCLEYPGGTSGEAIQPHPGSYWSTDLTSGE